MSTDSAIDNYIDRIIKEDEGGYVLTSNKDDPDGGWTYAGVTRKAFENWCGTTVTTKEVIKDLSGIGFAESFFIDKIYNFYIAEYWDKMNLSKMPFNYKTKPVNPLPLGILSCAINCGTKEAGIIIQKSLCACQQKVEIDGVIGNQTLSALKEVNPRYWSVKFCQEWMRYYINLVQKNAEAWRDYIESIEAELEYQDLPLPGDRGIYDAHTVDFLIKNKKPKVLRATSLEGWFNRVEKYRLLLS